MAYNGYQAYPQQFNNQNNTQQFNNAQQFNNGVQQYGGQQMPYGQQYNWQQQGQQPAPRPLTPPTIHADIIQVGSLQDAENMPVAPGESQMMMTSDDQAIVIKTVGTDGSYSLVYYDRRKQETKTGQYVTRDELERRLQELMDARKENE